MSPVAVSEGQLFDQIENSKAQVLPPQETVSLLVESPYVPNGKNCASRQRARKRERKDLSIGAEADYRPPRSPIRSLHFLMLPIVLSATVSSFVPPGSTHSASLAT